MMHTRWVNLLPAACLLVIVWPALGQNGLWFDEIFSVTMSRRLDNILYDLLPQENNMLLHYFFMWAWMPLGDDSETFLRSSSLLLVLLSLLPLHAAATRLLGTQGAFTACLLYVGQYLVLEHAPMCRGYALVLLISCLLCWSWLRAWDSDQLSHWLLTGMFAGFGVLAHYFMALLPAIMLFTMLWRDGLRQPWRSLLIASLVFMVMAAGMYVTRPAEGAAQIGWIDPPNAGYALYTLWMLAGADGPHDKLLIGGMLPILAALTAWQSWRAPPGSWRHPCAGLAVGLLLVVLAVLIESLLAQPLFVARYFTAFVPLYCLVLSAALGLVWPWLRLLIVISLLASSAWDNRYPANPEATAFRYHWKPLTEQLVQQLQPGDLLLVYPSYSRLSLNYYLDHFDPDARLPRPIEYASGPYRAGGGVEPEPDWVTVHELISNAPGRVWLVAVEMKQANWKRLNRIHAPSLRKQLQFLSGRKLTQRTRHGFITVERFDKPGER